MEDIFALDDAEVNVMSRAAPAGMESQTYSDDEQTNEYEVPVSVIANRATGTNNTRNPAKDDNRAQDLDQDFNFDYLPARTRNISRPTSPAPFDLGLDSEIVINKRIPQPKLDDERLLGPQGIPKIRNQVLPSLKFRGKGHELEDLNRFIERYQFWAHDLFPKAKFRDAVKMINKVGKTRRMKMHRRQIIDEFLGKSNAQDAERTIDDEAALREDRPADSLPGTGTATSQATKAAVEVDFDDAFSMSEDESVLLATNQQSTASGSTRPAQGVQGISNDIPDELPFEEIDDIDDMDALEAMGLA